MQKIFIITQNTIPFNNKDESAEKYYGNFSRVNEFIGEKGKIISVTPQHTSNTTGQMGRWVVVADNGKSLTI